MADQIRTVSIEQGQEGSAPARELKKLDLRAIAAEEIPPASDYREGKRILSVSSKKGEALGLCASLSEEYVCCNVHVLRSVSNCPYDCSYCFLQNYLTDGGMKVIGDVEALVREIKEKTKDHPWRFFRIGTWELGDSLALESYTRAAAELVESAKDMKNVLLELKTKSDAVDGLLGLDHGGRVVVSWTLNTEKIVRSEEIKTANLEERLDAMRKVAEAGYLIGAHFDPVILYEGCEEEYEDLVERVFKAVAPERVAWVSIGALRFNPEMKKKIEMNFPKSRITSQEMILGPDGKVRYAKPKRTAVYKRLYSAIRKTAGEGPFVYLCMERWDVWEKVLGYDPGSIGRLDYLMTKSLSERFPGLVHQKPDPALYVDGLD